MDSRQNGNGGKWHFREALNGDEDIWYRGSMDTVGVLLTEEKAATESSGINYRGVKW